MKKILIVGSGIAGLSCAIHCAEAGMEVTLVSPFPSERAQSVLAAGGINAVLKEGNDSIQSHIEDTLRGGLDMAGENAVRGLCESAPCIIEWLEKLGTVFSVESDGTVARRSFGGQSHARTCYCGSSTGKQIVSALVMESRRYEGLGQIHRLLWRDFYSALILDGVCYGAILYNESTQKTEIIRADYVVIATGGQNALFGRTTGSTLCDGYASGKLFMQGVELKNLEFIQYHPTTLQTDQKKMLISEAVRGEGGRLYYMDAGQRVYFMEQKYGERGNLMPRDVVSRCIEETGRDVYLDISFLEERVIKKRLPEVYELCLKYRGIDITKESIPVEPSVHFFMGGIAVKNNHETNIQNLYAIGECASIYHGANRLGGNSLLAAIYSGKVAASDMAERTGSTTGSEQDVGSRKTARLPDFQSEFDQSMDHLARLRESKSSFPVMYIRDMLAECMQDNLGIVRSEDRLLEGVRDITYYLSIADRINYDNSELIYFAYSLSGILTLAKATYMCALSRRESRGAHFRSDHPETDDTNAFATIISYDEGKYTTRLDRTGEYEK